MTLSLLKENSAPAVAALPAVAIRGLDPAPFASLFALDDAALLQRGIRRVRVPEAPGINYPCRISLDYPQAGEEMLLLNYRHLDVPTSPYRAEGPIFVRRGVSAFSLPDRFPPIAMQRAMAVRAYGHDGMMLDADLAEGQALTVMTRTWLADPSVAHVDIHSMRRGCFFCRAVRA